MIQAKVRADSISPVDVRIVTLELNMPRFLLAQFNTHRVFSRNAASSRAIPVSTMIDRVKADPFIPDAFGRNQKGMQAGEEIEETDKAKAIWDKARDMALMYADALASLNVHKQLANRLLEPFAYVSVLVTATEWENFFALRLHHASQPEMQQLAQAMDAAIRSSLPTRLSVGQWHMPFSEHMPANASLKQRLAIATARCARLSYCTHDGDFSPAKDILLHDKLWSDRHPSPFEHCAKVTGSHADSWFYNLRSWMSYRYALDRGYVFTEASE